MHRSLLLIVLFITISAFVTTSGSTFYYTKTPPNPSYAVLGQDLRLHWEYYCSDPRCPELYAVVFGVPGRYFVFRDIPSGRINIFPFSGQNETIDNQYKGRVTLLENNTMVISSFKPVDAVTYTSKLLTHDGKNIQESLVAVKVAVAPKLNKSPPDKIIKLKEGDSISLDCTASGTPAPKVTWRKNGLILSNQSIYTITITTRYQYGNYTCEASNIAGKTAWQGQVQSQVLPEPEENVTTITTVSPPSAGSTVSTRQDKQPPPLLMIVGSVVGSILVLAIVLGLFLCLRRKKEQARKDVERNKPAKEVKVHYNSDECEALVSSNATREHAHEAAETPTLLPSHTYETTNDTWNTTSTSVNSETAIGLYSAIDNGVNDDVNPYASADHNPEITTSKDSIYASADSLASVQSTPGSHTYAQVDKTKKKKKRKPGELLYADLDHDDQPSSPQEHCSSPTPYADIQIPEIREYYNVPQMMTKNKQDSLYDTIQNPDDVHA
ncbi:hemicentin-2 isoform X2 [Nematostella vectensis]|uniref:hemicentin-2 isoform X2 n=1 Tax=Nematostella vectensis TaxID=45351 RepID=UPI0020777B52|nr:hemicentin-2 isoform X2 [Nematostella vectensis]